MKAKVVTVLMTALVLALGSTASAALSFTEDFDSDYSNGDNIAGTHGWVQTAFVWGAVIDHATATSDLFMNTFSGEFGTWPQGAAQPFTTINSGKIILSTLLHVNTLGDNAIVGIFDDGNTNPAVSMSGYAVSLESNVTNGGWIKLIGFDADTETSNEGWTGESFPSLGWFKVELTIDYGTLNGSGGPTPTFRWIDVVETTGAETGSWSSPAGGPTTSFPDISTYGATNLGLVGGGSTYIDNINLIPEPATLAVLSIGGLLALLSRRRKQLVD